MMTTPEPGGPQIREIFLQALELTPADRAAFLDQACAGDDKLRAAVEALLAHHKDDSFLEQPAPGGPAAVATYPSEKPGDRIGRYQLLELIGEGGCGVVYMAEQEEPIRRRVALKVIKPGMDTRSVIARFEAERQTLALMDHPNIAKVFDAGTTGTGRPYFVMELVKGVPVTAYCDQHRLSTRQRLDLFMQVCHAVQHAHQKGIIHRDLKPSNVLVTSLDGVPVPQVIDFGIAKATAQPLTDKTLFTAFGQFIGTPAYMSPEQAELNALDIDTRSDIFSLGVLLYELLTGRTPFEPETLLKAGFDEMRRILRETEPAKPSMRLTELVAADVRRLQPPVSQPSTLNPQPADKASLRRLLHEVKGDLDWIVMKCLEKDRRRRYETASALVLDLQRHLNHEPVTAAAPTAAYRFQKFVRRHKTGLATATALVLLLVAGVAVSTWQAVRATRAEKQAVAESTKSRQVATFLRKMLEGVKPSVALGRDTTMMREILDKAAERVGKELKGQPEVEAELRLTIGETYDELGDYDKAEAQLREALAIWRKRFGHQHEWLAVSLHSLGQLLTRRGKLAEAEQILREAVAMSRKLGGDGHPNLPGSLASLASVLQDQGRLVEAEKLLREAGALREKYRSSGDENRIAFEGNLAGVLAKQGKFAELESMQREVLAAQRKLHGNEHPDVAKAMNNLAATLQDQGKPKEAEALWREAMILTEKFFGNEHPDVAVALNNLAVSLLKQGRLTEAETLCRETLAMRRKLLGPEHPDIAGTLSNLAAILREQSKLAEAVTLLREALAMRRKLLDQEHPNVAMTLNNLAGVLMDQGKLGEAETMSRDALVMQQKLLGREHPDVAQSLNNVAAMLQRQGKTAEAEALMREALALLKRVRGNEHPDVAGALANLANLLRIQWKLADAEPLAREALAMQTKLLGSEHPEVARTRTSLAATLTHQGKFAEADELFRQALSAQRKLFGGDHADIAETLKDLAGVLEERGQLVEAEALAREALTMCRNLLGNEPLAVAEYLNMLGSVLMRQVHKDTQSEAEKLFRESLAIKKRFLGDDHVEVAGTLNNLAGVLVVQGKLAEAEAMFRQALAVKRKVHGADHPETAMTLDNLGKALVQRSQFAEAEAMLREALEIRRRAFGPEHLEVASSLFGLGMLFEKRGDLALAETAFRDVLAMKRKFLGEEFDNVEVLLGSLGRVLQPQGKLWETGAVFRESTLARYGLLRASRNPQRLAEAAKVLGDASRADPNNAVFCLEAQAYLLGRLGQWHAAASNLAQAIKLHPRLESFYQGPLLLEIGDTPGYQNSRRRLWTTFSATEDAPTAAETAMGMLLQPAEIGLSTAIDLAELALTRGTNHARLPYFQLVKALADYRQKQFANASDWARKSLAGSTTNYTTAVAAGAVLAMAQQQLNEPGAARQTLSQAVQFSQTKLPKLESGDLGENWPEWLITRILLREATTLVEGRPATPKQQN